jgi:hypothetical protein
VGVEPGHKQKQQAELTANQAKADQRGTKDSPLVIDILSHPNSRQEAAESKSEKDRKDFVDTWTLRIAAIVAFFTGLLVWIGWRGVNAARETLEAIKATGKQTDKMIEQARKQADAARDAALAAKLNAQAVINSERPWVLVTIEQRATAPHIYDVQARNAGRTPAALVDGHCLWKRCPTDFALPDVLNDPITIPAQNLIVNGDGFPVRTINLNNQVPLPDEEGVGGDPQPPHVYGRLRYWDTFADRNAPEAQPHVTEWMFWYDQAAHRFRSYGRYAKNT